jgi:CheY-like chemotaxis protein
VPEPESKKSILVVDDEPMLRETVGRWLRRAGRQMVEAGDGEEAVAVLEQRAAEIELVLTDRHMPRGDGEWLIAEVRQRWPEMPILCLTADSDGLEVRVIEKPFLGPTLLRAIAEMIEEAERLRAAA